MTVAPPVGSFAAELYEDLDPLTYDDPNQDWALLAYCGALGAMFQTVRDLARQDTLGNPGWSLLLDVDRCPTAYLPYLGQFVGVQVDTSLTDAQQRDQIRAEQGMGRGTVAAIKAAAQKFLTGSKTVILLERTPDAYSYAVVTYASETPDYHLNLFRHGQCDATTDWVSTSGTTTIAIDTGVDPPFATQSISASWTTSGNGHGPSAQTATGLALPPGTPVSGSIYFKGNIGVTYRVKIRIFNTDASFTVSPNTDFVATGDWQLLTPASATVRPGTIGDKFAIQVSQTATTAETVWVAHAQLESGKTVPGLYIPTSGTTAFVLSPTVQAALNAAKPAGLIMTYSTVTGQIWAQLIASYATWADVIADYTTWRDVINNTP